ncbi:MAG: hypothetical protein R3213_12240, partial [Flavobacteriaceae bacterium]|nr:hypothetical protein [Flavobacteriaceae bacterium]
LQAGIRRNESGQEYIRILQQSGRPNDVYNSFPALVLIDGVFIPNHQMITNYNAYKIEEIKIVNEQYQLGDKIYQGIMAIKTFDGDFYSEYESEYGIKTSKPIPLPRKNYFQQKYSTNKTDLHIPDYRRILYWEPQMEILENSKKLEFYTSDIAGHYLISLNGFTSYGKPITVISGFEVVTNNH